MSAAAVAWLALSAACTACAGGGSPSSPAPPPPPPPPPPPVCTFTNPLAPGADPWVVKDNGVYYLSQSADNGITVSRSTKLSQVTGTPVRVWAAPDTGWNRTNVWAPELHHINGHWYIYYAAGSDGPPFIHQRAGVLESVADDPQGQYVSKGQLYTGDGGENIWAIDLTVGTINGQLYAVWSGWEQNAATDRTQQNLYIARMSDPWTIQGPRVKLSSPTESWEKGTELDLQEGPEFLVHGGQTFIIYSTRESWLPAYRLGQLRLTPGTDPLNPASWVKSGPVFQATPQVPGPGHASFTQSPDGSQDWIVYHAKNNSAPGWDRSIRMQPFSWNADGSPNFGTPVSPGVEIDRPAGDCTG